MKSINIHKAILLLLATFFVFRSSAESLRHSRSEASDPTEQERRRVRAVDAEIQSFEKRVEDTLKRRNLFKDGDDLKVDLDNVKIQVGTVERKNSKSERGISMSTKDRKENKNGDFDKQITFKVSDKADFDRTFSAEVSRGFKWKKGDIEAESKITPGAKNDDKVKFSLSTKDVSAFDKPLSLSFKFDDIKLSPRTKAEQKFYFQIVEESADFDVKLAIKADGKVKCRITKKNKNKPTQVELTLRDALSPNQGGGFREGKDNDEVLFIAKGKNFWTTTNQAQLEVKHFSLDGKGKDIPYKSVIQDDNVSI